MRVRVSQEERELLHSKCEAEGVTASLAIRRALVAAGLFPRESLSAAPMELDQKATSRADH